MIQINHTQLFADGNTIEVYEALQRDFDKDSRRQLFWQWVLVLCAVGAALISQHFDWLWIFGGLLAVERSIAAFIDNSNRNWFMHMIDKSESDRAQQLRD